MIKVMDLIPANYMYWLIAVAAYILVEVVWWSPQVFGKTFMKLAKIKSKDYRWDAQKAFGTFVSAAIMTSVLMVFMKYMGTMSAMDGIYVAAYAWFGFIAPSKFCGVLWCNLSMEHYLIDVGYYLVALCTVGGILGAYVVR